MKKVSIIISTYNRAETFLGKAIESAVNQTYKNTEIIVVDDCSTDNTEEVVRRFPSVRYIKLESNFGKDTRPKNTGILASTGEYICYLDDDCEFTEHHVEALVAALEMKKADVAYCDMLLKEEGKPLQPAIQHNPDAQFLMRKNYIDTSMILHTREIVFAVGGWDETLPRFVDWNLVVRMMKYGAKFVRMAHPLTIYTVHKGSYSQKCQVKTWRDPVLGQMFEPTFDPAGCEIVLPYLGVSPCFGERHASPRVAVFTLSYNRKEYTERFKESLFKTAGYPLRWFVVEQGSHDGSAEMVASWCGRSEQMKGWIEGDQMSVLLLEDNVGISEGSNLAVDKILSEGYDIVIKIDNDCTFLTEGWLETIVDLWKRNRKLYVSPYVEGLVQNPGGAHRIGYSHIGGYFVEVSPHIGGIFASVDASAYKEFRWKDKFLHGNQDREASVAFKALGFMPMYLPLHRIQHTDGTEGQHEKYPEYFKKRVIEKTTAYEK